MGAGIDMCFTNPGTSEMHPAVRAATAEELDGALRRAHAEPGPHLIEAIVPPVA